MKPMRLYPLTLALGITAALWVAILREGGLAVGKGPGTQAADKLSPTVR